MDDGTLVVAVASLPKEIAAGLQPKRNNFIRGFLLQSGWVVEKLEDDSCLVTYVIQALADPYFHGLANVEHEPSTQLISKLEFEFERRKLSKDDILEYHPQMLHEYLRSGDQTSFMYPSGVDRFMRQFAHLEEHCGNGERATRVLRPNTSLP